MAWSNNDTEARLQQTENEAGAKHDPRALKLNQEVRILMISREINSREELMRRLNDTGDYSVSKTTLHGYLRGDVDPPRKFIRTLERALDLSSEERRHLADVFAYGD